MSAKRAVYLLRGIHFTLGTSLVLFTTIMSLTALFLSGACGRVDNSAPISMLVGGKEWDVFDCLCAIYLKEI